MRSSVAGAMSAGIRLALAAAIALSVAACSSRDSANADTTDTGRAAESHAGETEGEAHAEGAESARVTLTEAAFQTAQIRIELVGADAAGTGEDLEVPGQVEYDPRRVAVISARTPGRLERLTVVEGDRVRAGQTVALLYSPAYVTAQNDLMQAVRRARLLAGTQDEQGALAIAEAARRRLRLLGAGPAVIESVEASQEPAHYLAISAPFSGTITERHSLPGQAVEAGQEIFKVADLSVVDVVAAIPERALPLVEVGQAATIALAAYPDRRFDGRVERLRGELNAETRTIEAVIHAANASGRLRPGMFATVRLAVPLGSTAQGNDGSAISITVPESAVVSEGEKRYVFVEVGPRTFERRAVEVASLAPPGSASPIANRVAIKSGLTPGDRVVVTGAFTLKSELAKAGLGEHGH